MAYRGFGRHYVGEIPAGDGGINLHENPARIPLSDVRQADGLIQENGVWRKQPGAAFYDATGIAGAVRHTATIAPSSYWGASLTPFKATAPSFTGLIGKAGTLGDVELSVTVGVGGVAAGQLVCVSVSYQFFGLGISIGVVDSKGNTYTEINDGPMGGNNLEAHALFYSRLTTPLVSGDEITVLASQTSRLGMICSAFGGVPSPVALQGQLKENHETTSPTTALSVGPTVLGALDALVIVTSGAPDDTGPLTTYTDTSPGAFTTVAQQDTDDTSLVQLYRFVTAPTPTIIALHDWRPTSTVQHLVTATQDGILYSDEGTGNLDAVTLASGLSTTARPGKFVEGGKEAAANNRKLFYFNGVNAPRVRTGGGGTMTALSLPPADWSGTNQPVFGIIHRNRLAACGNLNDPHRLYLSTLADHQDFQGAGTLSFAVYPSLGDRLYSGVSLQGLLWLAKWPRGIFWLDDSDPDTANWEVQPLTDAIGAAPTPYAMLRIDNDAMLLAADGTFHLLGAVASGVVRDSNLSELLHHAQWLRDNLNLGKLSNAVSVYYPHKKWAVWGLTSKNAQTNDLTVLFDFSRMVGSIGQEPLPPMFFKSSRDLVDSLALRLEADQIERPMLGEGGYVFLLDRASRTKDGASDNFVSWETPATDFAAVAPALAGREKAFDHLVLDLTPTSGTLTIDVEIDGTVRYTRQADLSLRRQRLRLGGVGHELALLHSNTVDGVDVKVRRELVYFREAAEGKSQVQV
jgi:hypothetical protein